MEITTFIRNYREAFGDNTDLPLVFWYSEDKLYPTEKIPGCFFKVFGSVREGAPVSLDAAVIGCGGGKLYTGFSEMPPHVPVFVSGKERYKKTPEMVVDYIEQLSMPRMDGLYLNFARVDLIDTFEDKEGVVFFGTADVMSGLATWAFYDSNQEDTIVAGFGSGCGTVVSQATVENRRGGGRCFLGLFDPSVRPWFAADELSFTIPMSRFGEMYHTMRESCLFDTHAWIKVRERINKKD